MKSHDPGCLLDDKCTCDDLDEMDRIEAEESDHIPDATKMVEDDENLICLTCGRRLQLVRPGKHQCDYCETDPDYHAVYVKRSAKDRGNFLLNVMAKGKTDALRIARQHGHKLPRWSYAVHIGKAGYHAALRQAFGQNRLCS